MPGVDTDQHAREAGEDAAQRHHAGSAGRFFVLAGVLLASSLFLIVNTIRLATFARRREIEVMKLVGASNWFVRVPFMAEGLVQGAIGAGFAVGLVYFLKWIITNLLKNQHNLLQPFYASSHDVFVIGIARAR